MTPLEFSVIFSLGLASGVHCLGMCGPIVLAYSLPLPKGRRLRAHLSYNAGRILTYMALGAVAGAAGGALGMLGRMAGLATGARIVAGAAMVIAGALMISRLRLPKLVQIAPKIQDRGKFALGLTLGFLPCGLVYAALLKAMESAGALSGALTMLAFGLGTAAALLGMGALSSFAGARLGRWSNRLAAVSVMAAGALLLWRGLVSPGAPLCHARF